MSFIAKTIGQLMTALNPGRKEKALYLAGTDHPPVRPLMCWIMSKRQYGNFCMSLKFMRLPA